MLKWVQDLQRLIDDEIKKPLSNDLFGELQEGGMVEIDLSDDVIQDCN